MGDQGKDEVDRFGISMPAALKARLDRAIDAGYFSANDRSSTICYCVTLVLDMFDKGVNEQTYRLLNDFISLIKERPAVIDALLVLIKPKLE
jgi:hypothetical protein